VHPFLLSHEEKMSLFEPSMEGTAMARVGAPWEAMGELTREGKEGEGEGGEGAWLGGAAEGGAMGRGCGHSGRSWLLPAHVLLCCL
jgi:hypothetical protein